MTGYIDRYQIKLSKTRSSKHNQYDKNGVEIFADVNFEDEKIPFDRIPPEVEHKIDLLISTINAKIDQTIEDMDNQSVKEVDINKYDL